MNAPLKLYARDADDMAVLSACLQDAIGQIADLAYVEDTRRFVMLVNRYCWENEVVPMRVRSALQVAAVNGVSYRKLNLGRRDGVVALLAVQFEPDDAPSGIVRLIFAGGGEIRLEVEACEAILEDITAPWAARSQPAHEDDEA